VGTKQKTMKTQEEKMLQEDRSRAAYMEGLLREHLPEARAEVSDVARLDLPGGGVVFEVYYSVDGLPLYARCENLQIGVRSIANDYRCAVHGLPAGGDAVAPQGVVGRSLFDTLAGAVNPHSSLEALRRAEAAVGQRAFQVTT
jgi:hypothetical protein